MRIAVLTGGGDAPGLNPFLRALAFGLRDGESLIGFRRGYLGLVEDDVCDPLDRARTREWDTHGGTHLLANNRQEPFSLPAPHAAPDAGTASHDAALAHAIDNLRRHAIDTLIVVGGDGTLRIARALAPHLPSAVIGVPKTIDGDVPGTDATLGLATARSVCVRCVDEVLGTARSHARAIFVETMGRTSGRLALSSALASDADGVLLAERPFDLEALIARVRARHREQGHARVVVSEGVDRTDGPSIARTRHQGATPSPDPGVVHTIAALVEAQCGIECRGLVVGHLQRGAPPVAEDRALARTFAAAALQAAREGRSAHAIGIRDGAVVIDPLAREGQPTSVLSDDDPELAVARAFDLLWDQAPSP